MGPEQQEWIYPFICLNSEMLERILSTDLSLVDAAVLVMESDNTVTLVELVSNGQITITEKEMDNLKKAKYVSDMVIILTIFYEDETVITLPCFIKQEEVVKGSLGFANGRYLTTSITFTTSTLSPFAEEILEALQEAIDIERAKEEEDAEEEE